jgi:hypothetical protein
VDVDALGSGGLSQQRRSSYRATDEHPEHFTARWPQDISG